MATYRPGGVLPSGGGFMRDKTGVKVTKDKWEGIRDAIRGLANEEVLVGFPEDTSARDPDDAEDREITNAALGYIHDNGAPEQNIPARPFMIPGMNDAKAQATKILAGAARQALRLGAASNQPDAGLTAVGLAVQAAIRRKINSGIPPPLADSTLQRRAAKGRKGAAEELENRAQGKASSTQLAKPLVDTAQMRNAVNFVIRGRKRRR